MCRRCYEADLRKRNPEYASRQRLNTKHWLQQHPNYKRTPRTPEYRRELSLKLKYGMTSEDFETLFKDQNGKCAICLKRSKKRLHIDHCHKTNIIRGLLCFRCNYGLSWFSEDVERFEKVVKYLKNDYQL